MNHRKNTNDMRQILFLLAICLCAPLASRACTSIIITGKATPDGRPLMWKHRDTGAPYNHIRYFDEGGYRFLGLVNSDDPEGAVWTGSNEKGFSIMNTASYNLKDDDVEEMDREGILMREALKVCGSVADFERFLDTLARPMRVEANFGVIDAYGGAAYFETDNWRYHKKDANDPRLAPDGYLIYTNFSFEGRPDEGKGYVRYENARKIFADMRDGEGLTPQRIFRLASRSFYNSLLGIDLLDEATSPNNHTGWFVEQDFIPRQESSAAIVVQGVRPGMPADQTVMWTALGYPPAAIALPLWVRMGEGQPKSVSYDEGLRTAPADHHAVELLHKLYPIHRGNGQKYLHWSLLWNKEGSGYMQRLQPAEDRIFSLFVPAMKRWESEGLDPDELAGLYREADRIVEEAYGAIPR